MFSSYIIQTGVKVNLAGLFTVAESTAGCCRVWDLLLQERTVTAVCYHCENKQTGLKTHSKLLALKNVTILRHFGTLKAGNDQ